MVTAKTGPRYCIDQLVGLAEMARDVMSPDSTIIEVGSFVGISTMFFAKICKHVYSVDIKRRKTLLKRARKFKNITIITGDSRVVHERFEDGSVDGVYIDGDHSYPAVKDDIINFAPKATKFVAGHDLSTIGEIGWHVLNFYGRDKWEEVQGVELAVEELIGLENVRHYSDSSWATLKC